METMAIAESGNAMVTAFTAIGGEVTSAIGGIAPIAIGIMGVFLVWKLGIKFFKTTASK